MDTGILRKVWLRQEKKEIKMRRALRVWSRGSCIPSGLKLRGIGVYKGNKFTRVKYNKLTVFHRCGEFAFTKKPFYYPNIKKKKK